MPTASARSPWRPSRTPSSTARCLYDKAGEQHYDLISALHKSMRGSDPDASLYWLARMLEAGEDPLYIARRLVRFASEDVGMADPQALVVAMAAQQAVHFIGMPEGNLALAEAAVYLATAPKSNSLYAGLLRGAGRDQERRQRAGAAAPAQRGDAADEGAWATARTTSTPTTTPATSSSSRTCRIPKDKKFYTPSGQGHETEIAERLKKWRPETVDNKEK